MEIQLLPIDSIKVENRAREDMGDIDSLVESIKDVGLLQPITVNEHKRLLAGGRRLMACQQAGLTEIPAIVRHTNGSKIDMLEVELIENVARKDMTWQERAKLEKTIYDLKKDKDPNWSRRKQEEATGTSKSEIQRRIELAEAMELLPELGQCDTQDEAWKQFKKLEENFVAEELARKVPESIKQASKWAVNHYNIGDALEKLSMCNEGIAHFAEVDPPYAVNLEKMKERTFGSGQRKEKHLREAYNEIDPDEYVPFLERMAKEVYRVLRPHSFAVFWFGPTWHNEVRDVLRKVGFGVGDIPAIWHRVGPGQTNHPDISFGSCYEPFWLARKGKPKLAKPGRGNVFTFEPVPPNKKIHTTEKPLALLTEILQTCLFPGSAIVVPFLGSGVTLRAAYKLGHTGWGYDLDERNKELFLRKVRKDMKQSTDN